MHPLPKALLSSLEGIPGFDRTAFEAVHAAGPQITSVRVNERKCAFAAVSHLPLLQAASRVSWCSSGYYLPERPSFTFDPLFHAGAYYVQEASSMFLEQVFIQTAGNDKPMRVLDLCAAPGGKSTLLHSLLADDALLVSNEVIRQRVAVLDENLIKWGGANVVVTNNDPAHFARLPAFFDAMIVDAPCSGSGLFRRDPEAITEWSEANVALCSQRQQRILADAWPALKTDGWLIYATCSYSVEEDESILDWMGDHLPVESFRVRLNDSWHITEVRSRKHGFYGYRFYPDKVAGEGFFIAALRKTAGDAANSSRTVKPSAEKITKTEETLVGTWLAPDDQLGFFRQGQDIVAMRLEAFKHLPVLQQALYIKRAGICIGRPAGKDLVPDHQLAMSLLVSPSIAHVDATKQEALQYLRKEDAGLPVSGKGWALVNHEHFHLGWIKMMPHRYNNYYPKEWRILKALP